MFCHGLSLLDAQARDFAPTPHSSGLPARIVLIPVTFTPVEKSHSMRCHSNPQLKLVLMGASEGKDFQRENGMETKDG